jgi:hypothetical protein
MTTANKQKLPSDFYDVESAKGLRNSGQEITSLSGSPYPDNFHVGKAIGNGSCFFDSFRQGLEQQKGIEVTVEQLRRDCKEFAQNNPPEWFISGISNDFDEVRGRFVNCGITCDQYINKIEKNEFWGRPDIEGRMLCGKYGVKLHVVESNPLCAVSNQQDPFLHQLIDSSDSKNAGEYNEVNYDDSSVLHIINKGHAHFEPLLDRKKSLAKQEQEDFLLAKKLQLDEILEYCNISKDSPKKEEVEKRFDELLAKNADGKISDVVEQCVSDIKQRVQRSEKQSPLSPSCGIEEARVERIFRQQQAQQPVKSC